MVNLTITPRILSAIQAYNSGAGDSDNNIPLPSKPSLENPQLGDPISHSQITALSKTLQAHSRQSQDEPPEQTYSLDHLLRGSSIHIAPLPPKPASAKNKKTPEYLALMARLRREEEAAAYERMLNPSPLLNKENFAQRFPNATNSKLFSSSSLGPSQKDSDEEEITFQDVSRQLALIINILLSIVACSVALWLAARHWSTPRRLGLSMGGSLCVAMAEVGVYAGYLRRVREAKVKGRKEKEVRSVVERWELGGNGKAGKMEGIEDVMLQSGEGWEKNSSGVRKRRLKPE